MNVKDKNRALALGELDRRGLFPHIEALAEVPYVFEVRFGLHDLPVEPGVILVRGPRQYGKSTWLERGLRASAERFGPGSAFYLNGDDLRDEDSLVREIRELLPLYAMRSRPRRLFIDEITAVRNWASGMKRLVDAGEVRDVLVVTTGSKATDLRRGTERLPGRKGKLDRSTFVFTPVSFSEFRRVCGEVLGQRTLVAYLLSGGSPVACGELAAHGRLPEYVPEMIRDWIDGECAVSGRSRASLRAVMQCIHRFAGTPLGQAKLARESGLANNTVAAGYVELLADLMCVGITQACDPLRRIRLARKPAKYPMTNLLAAVAWDPARMRTLADFEALSPQRQGGWFEWLVAQELWRRSAVRGEDTPEMSAYWQGGGHEIDYVRDGRLFLEVKRGKSTAVEFSWFPRAFPGGKLVVVSSSRFETERIRGLTMEDFLLDETSDLPGGAG